jgi:predicted amidophosphoribosyltransferase
VHAFKDEAARGLARPLAGLLAAAVLGVLRAPVGRAAEQAAGRAADPLRMPRSGGRQGVAPVWLVPVPARRAARRARGSDHMRELARLAARQLRHAGVPAHRLDLLAHVAASRDQVGLGRAERRANVTGTLAARGPVPAGLLVVVDDVTTTGATLAEAVRALRASAPGRPVRAAAITWAGPPAHPAAGLASPAGHD